jgi:hypothetical protein
MDVAVLDDDDCIDMDDEVDDVDTGVIVVVDVDIGNSDGVEDIIGSTDDDVIIVVVTVRHGRFCNKKVSGTIWRGGPLAGITGEEVCNVH